MANVSRQSRRTPAVRISYPAVFQARAVNPGDTPRFGVVLMFEKNNKEHMAFLAEIRKDLQECLVERWPDETKRPRKKLVGDTLSPIKDGDTTENQNGIPLCEANPEYAGCFIIRANATSKPVVVDRATQPIIDTNEIYGGCYCKAHINAYAYTGKQNSGVTIGLNGLQKWEDGDSFGMNRMAADTMFDAEMGQNDPANYQSADGSDPFAVDDDIPF